jgi:hypothetical protein
MGNERDNGLITSSVLAWGSHQGAHLQHAPDDEEAADLDEPPDLAFGPNSARTQFQRTVVPRIADHSVSLLTKALKSDEENAPSQHHGSLARRRSLTSNVSFASTADLTSDTGFTSPARTNTPSPPLPAISFVRLNRDVLDAKGGVVAHGDSGSGVALAQPGLAPMQLSGRKQDPAVELLQKKRRISFVCAPKPEVKQPQPQPAGSTLTTEGKAPRKTCIKFACPAKPTPGAGPLQGEQRDRTSTSIEIQAKRRTTSPAMTRKHRSPSATQSRRQRSPTPHATSQSITTAPSKYLTADADDLNTESSRFHEFASDEPLQEDWMRQNLPSTSARLTINDTLRKENEIRRIGKEAEEEALEEEEEEEAALEDEEDIDLTNDYDEDYDDAEDEEDEEEFDAQSGYGSDEIASDGYNTDNETGFADSEDEDDGELQLWTPGTGLALRLSTDTLICRRPSLAGERSDSSSSEGINKKKFRGRSRKIKFRPGTPELPDSTDFVCGTLDEDRVLENAYISCMAVKRREKLHPIPQDIDPSFPTSEPEDEEMQPHRRGHESDEQLWLHGELEDLHHTKDRDGEQRTKKLGHTSPKRYRSPPPKNRGRSPRRLFDGLSPRRLMSPPPAGRFLRSPPASMVQDGPCQDAHFKTLAFRPGLTHTKSLPRASAIFPPHIRNQRRTVKTSEPGGHVRGAIDIVKGLEQKRQRRREKFKEKYMQKHNSKARKGQLPQQRPQPGKGAERMREIGLLSAGKLDPDRYVLSV